MEKLHKALAVAGVVAVIAIPIVGHSAYGGDAHVQMMLTLLSAALGVVGFTAAKPLLAGDPQELQRTHRMLATLGMVGATVLPMLAQTYSDNHAVKLALDISTSVLDAAGFAAVRPLGASAAAAAARALLFISIGSMAVGCAHGTDGLRQTCANTDKILNGAYETTTAIYRTDQRALRAKITKDSADQVAAVATSHDDAFDKLVSVLDAATATTTTVCAMADAIDAGVKKDLNQLVAQVVQVGLDVANAVAQFKKTLVEVGIARLGAGNGGGEISFADGAGGGGTTLVLQKFSRVGSSPSVVH